MVGPFLYFKPSLYFRPGFYLKIYSIRAYGFRSGLRDRYVGRRSGDACRADVCSDGPHCLVETASRKAQHLDRSASRRQKDATATGCRQEAAVMTKLTQGGHSPGSLEKSRNRDVVGEVGRSGKSCGKDGEFDLVCRVVTL